MDYKIAIYSLTRDRLAYTKHCFQTLKEKACYPYDHYVIDNGSTDGTVEWLKENEKDFKKVIYNPENAGISRASNQALDEIFKEQYSLVCKLDNDCEVISDNILGQIVEVFKDVKDFSGKYVLSPRVEGISNQPIRGKYEMLSGRRIGLTAIIGGLFHIVPAEIYAQYRYPIILPKAWGQDDHFCNWFKQNGGNVGYIEGLVVNHYETTDGQAKRFPEYFERKKNEETN